MQLFKRTKKDAALVRYEAPTDADPSLPAIAVTGREVVLHRPELVLNLTTGETVAGVDQQLACNYLVAALGLLTQEQHQGATVEFVSNKGRFATAEFTLPSWGVSLEVTQPIGVVDDRVAKIFTVYRKALAEKAKELHKGTQNYGMANGTLMDVLQKWQGLRELDFPVLNDAEFIYCKTAFLNAITLNALVPVPVGDTAQMITPEAKPAMNTCASCGAEQPITDKFCRHCGASLTTA